MAKLIKDVPGFEDCRFTGLFKNEEVLMYDPTTRRTTRSNTEGTVPLTAAQERARVEMLIGMGQKMEIPPFLWEEQQREADHALQVRRDKKRRELGEMYPDTPGKWLDDAVDQAIPRTVPVTSPGITGGWYAPTETVYDQHDVLGLPTLNHPCTLVFETGNEPDGLAMCGSSCKFLLGAELPYWIHDIACNGNPPKPQQEEGPHSMYSNEAIQQAEYTLNQERGTREAAEIIDRIKAFGEDVYADGTVLRFSRQFYKNNAKTQLHSPAVFSALRYTDACGNTQWRDDEGTKRTWDALVTWFVTWGKPITLADVEIFPPANFLPETVFPATNEVTVQ